MDRTITWEFLSFGQIKVAIIKDATSRTFHRINLNIKLCVYQVARFQQEAAGLARARAEKESELRKLRQENDKYVEDMEEREKKFQV